MVMRVRSSAARSLLILAAGIAGAALAAAPTGVQGFDLVWSAALVAGLAYAAAFASPMVLLPAASGAAVLANTGEALGLAAAAVVAAVVAAGQSRPSSRLTALAGGLLGLALLRRGDGSAVAGLGGGMLVAGAVGVSGWGGMSRRRRRQVTWGLGGLVGALLLAAGAGGLAGLSARTDAEQGIDALRAARVAATSGRVDEAVEGFRAAERAFQSAGEPLHGYGRLGRLVPGLSQQLEAATVAVDVAADTSTALRQVGRSLHLDDVSLRQGTIDLAVLSDAEAPLESAVEALVDTVRRLSAVDRDALFPPVRDALDDALDEARSAATTAERAHRAVIEMPALLGAERPTRWLVLFTSPVEARNRFGFPGAYAVLRFELGHLTIERSGPIGDLDAAAGTIDASAIQVPSRALPYIGYGVARTWRSVTLPADGPSVTDLAIRMAALSGLGTIDGFVMADPHALAAIVGLVGNVPVPGVDVTLTAENTADYINRRQYLEFPTDQTQDRKDALVEIAGLVGGRLSTLDVSSVQDLADRFGPLVQSGHLTIGVPTGVRPGAADLLHDVGTDGGLELPRDADLLYVGQRNHVGNKIDLFLHRDIAYDVRVTADGALTAELAIDLTNDAPGGGLPPYLIGSALADPPPPGTNLSTTLIYSPYELRALTVDGVPQTPPVLADGGLLVYQVEVALGPGEHRRIEATFAGPAPAGAYALRVVPGTLVVPDRLTVTASDARSGREDKLEVPAVSTPLCFGVARTPRC